MTSSTRPIARSGASTSITGFGGPGAESPREATEALVELVAERLALAPGQAVVDIGCGYGASAAQLAERHRRRGDRAHHLGGAGADRRRRAAMSPASQRDWLDNGLADAAFDRAYAIESSEHMVDKARFFAEAFRVLKPGGRLVVCAWLAQERAGPVRNPPPARADLPRGQAAEHGQPRGL